MPAHKTGMLCMSTMRSHALGKIPTVALLSNTLEATRMDLRFDGKLVAVSGAGHGLGQAIAESFASLGARVFGCGPVPATVAGATMAVVDLTDRAAAAAWIAGIEQEAGAPLDVLVNNAGGVAGQVFRPIEEITDADWDGVLAVNLGAAFALSRAAAPGMKRAGRGRIVNISSGAGLQASLTGIQAYASAKHAVIGLTRQLAHEFGPYGITVNSVAPGLIPSNPASQSQWEGYGPAKQAAMVQGIALRRLGTPQDIANAVLFFASPLADFVNGQILLVDGGK
jgi:3-oxoacyl-[acyl-carrier protein] reductase